MTSPGDLFAAGLALQEASEALLSAALKLKAASAELEVAPPMPQPAMDATSSSQMLNAAQVAERLCLAKSTVYRLIESGELPSVSIGRARRVREADLVAWRGTLPAPAPEPEMEIRQPVTRFGRPVALPKAVAR